MARVLWIPCAEPGSLYPAVPIALELARRGHDMTVLCQPGSRRMFERLGFEFRPTRELATVQPPRPDGGRAAKLAWQARSVCALYADTSQALAAGAFDAVLVDPLETGGGFAAEAAGVPSVSYVHWRMSETGADIPFCFHFWNRGQPAEEAFVAWWNEQRALVGLAPEPRPPREHRWYRHSQRLTLILGLPELVEPKGDLAPYAVRVGPTVWEPPHEEPLPDWVERLGRGRPAVLASASTVGAADRRFAAAVGRAVAGVDVDVVLTVATAGELPPLPENVRIAPFVPHGELLPRLGLVVSHAGNGTVTRAACAGVPLLLLPAGRDQFEVARGAAAAGIALVGDSEQADASCLRAALQSLLETPGFRSRASEVARRAAAYDARGTAADLIDLVVASPGQLRSSSTPRRAPTSSSRASTPW